MCVKQREHDHSQTDRPGVAAHRLPARPGGQEPASLSDVDGARVDSVYQHVLAWQEALGETGEEGRGRQER